MSNSIKLLKKLAAIMMIAVLATGVLPFEPFEALIRAEAEYVEISSAEDLDLLIRNDPNGKFILTKDIELSKYPFNTSTWTESGGWEAIATFKGELNGNNHVITGLWSNGRGSNQGLFALLSGAYIHDLSIRLDQKGITGIGERKGALAGTALGKTKITNVQIRGQQGGSPITGAVNYIAGMIGTVNEGTTITDSSVSNLDLQGNSYVGGLVGVAYGLGLGDKNSKITGCSVDNVNIFSETSYAGGFAGAIYEGAAVNFNNVTNVDVKTRISYGGGFAGAIYNNSSLEYNFVEKAKVSGSIVGGFSGIIYEFATVNSSRAKDVTVHGNTYAGGFAGQIHGFANVFKSCAYGTVESTGHYAGGFAGEIAFAPTISNCYSQVNTSTDSSYAGSFVGYYSGGKIENVYGAGTVNATKYGGRFSGYTVKGYVGKNYYDLDLTENCEKPHGAGNLTTKPSNPQGYATELMMKRNTFDTWDFESIWGIEEDKTYPYFIYINNKLKSKPPTIDSVSREDENITGAGVPGAEVTVIFPGEGLLAQATVDGEGRWTVRVPGELELKPGDIIGAYQAEPDKYTSTTTETTVLGVVKPYTFQTMKNLSGSSGKYRVGDQLEYTITIENIGDEDTVLKNIRLKNVIPDATSYIMDSLNVSGGTENFDEQEEPFTQDGFEVMVGELPKGQKATIRFRVLIVKSNTEISNSYFLTFDR